ncbi:MAG: hypothetical protein HYX78_11595 [Armatimonadetes bacterium]|nr:hypothetical protein [Armatimonadota bacterium]
MSVKSILRSRKGSGMVLGLFALLILFAFGIAFLSSSTGSVIASKRDYLSARALSVAEAGVERAMSYLRGTAPDGSTDGSWRTGHPAEGPDDHSGDTWHQETLATGESFKICVRTAAGGDTSRIIVTSVSTVTHGDSTASRTLKVLVERDEENVSPWNNVIFGGVGQTGRSIQGNVRMRGPVHLLGDGEEFTDVDGDGHWDDDEPYVDANTNGQYDAGESYTDVDGDGRRDAREPFVDVNGNGIRDPALTVTDLAQEVSGTADVGNNYDGMPVLLQNKLPTLPTVSFGGETVETLTAKMRVKHGRVDISGSAVVGYPNSTGNALKETMDGVYVSDGFGGNQGTAAVNSDNGSSQGYDLGDGIVEFPALGDPKPGYGGTYKDYLRNNGLVIPGSLSLTPGVPYSNSSGGNSISYDGSGNLEITGIVYVDGDLNLNKSPSVQTLMYEGSGTLFATGDVYVHCNVLPQTNFPLTDRLGLIAGAKMEIATGPGDAQLTMALAMYAQYKIKIGKQCEIAGSCVSSYYEMQNVPHLYHVPELPNNLPPGMPGGDPIYVVTISVKSWQDFAGSAD